MWFNASLDHQFAFDAVAGEYEGARLRFGVELVARIATEAGLAPGDPVYEVGAGTGQLTEGLLRYGFGVTANEPGELMRAQLADLRHERLELRGGRFEDDPIAAGSFAAVFAANSFHWIDPAVAFAKAAATVGPGGALCLVWNFAFLDAPVQTRLNASAFAGHADLIQDPALSIDAFADVMAAGRDLITASGHFASPRFDWQTVERRLSVADYADLTVSYASTAALAEDVRLDLQDRIFTDLDALGVDEVVIHDHVYFCVARAL